MRGTLRVAIVVILVVVVIIPTYVAIVQKNTPVGPTPEPTPIPPIIPTPIPPPEPTLTTQTPTPTSVATQSSLNVAESLMENGICYGPYRDGQSPGSHVYPSVQQITDDLQSIRSMTSRIRTYSSTNISASIPIIAKQKGLTVYQGVNLSSNQSQNDREIASAIELANQGLVDYLIVGNEILLTKALNKSELIDYMDSGQTERSTQCESDHSRTL